MLLYAESPALCLGSRLFADPFNFPPLLSLLNDRYLKCKQETEEKTSHTVTVISVQANRAIRVGKLQ